MLSYVQTYYSQETTGEELRWFVLLGGFDLALIAMNRLLYRMIKGNPNPYLVLQQQVGFRKATAFRPPSMAVLKLGTIVFRYFFPSKIVRTMDYDSKAFFVTNASTLDLGLPMLIVVW